MSTATIAKSVMRKNDNISVGYGEVPAKEFITEDGEPTGITCWGLPGGRITFSEEEALDYAIKLDKEIRLHLKDIKQLATTLK